MKYWIRQFFSRAATHRLAIAEVGITAIVSLAPLLITALVYNYQRDGGFDLIQGVKQAIGGGQLYLYAYALFGTVIWLSFMRWDKPMNGPRRFLGFVSVIIALLIVAMLGVDPTISNAKNAVIIMSSYWVYGGFIVIHYLLLFFVNIDPPDAGEAIAAGSATLIKRYKRYADGGVS